MAGFLVGTAGWSYRDWVGPFYPEGTAAAGYLAIYAGVFRAVEVDSTFYRIPSRRMTTGWAETTPPGFVFSPKMVQEVTHERFLEDCGDLVEAYLAAMAPLGDKLGPVILQFPYFPKSSGVVLDGFLGRLGPFLDRLPSSPRFAVEVRNKTFLRPELFSALRMRKVALVLVDHVWMPGPREYRRDEAAITADFVPIRLIGDRRGIEKTTTTWNTVVVDREERLRDWAELIRDALRKGLDVQAFANNHYAGFGPATARRLADLVEGRE